MKTTPDGRLGEDLVGSGWRKTNRNADTPAETPADSADTADIAGADTADGADIEDDGGADAPALDVGQVIPPSVIESLNLTVGAARRAHAVRAWGSVVELVEKLERGGAVFAVSASQFSALDVLFAVLEKIGPAKVDLWTYTPGQTEAEALGRLLGEGRITDLRLVLDQSGMHTRGVELYQRIQARFGPASVRVSKAHCKLVALSTDDGWRVVIDGSANLAKNLRFEQVNIRDDVAVWTVVHELTTELFAVAPPPDLGQFAGADARRTVKAIAGEKPWSPAVGPSLASGADASIPAPEALDEVDLGEDVVARLLSGQGYDLAHAERIKANALALRQLVNARREAGALIEIELAERVLFEGSRAIRDAWLNWPQRVGPLIAADLDVPVGRVTEALATHVHEQLAQLGEPEADFAA